MGGGWVHALNGGLAAQVGYCLGLCPDAVWELLGRIYGGGGGRCAVPGCDREDCKVDASGGGGGGGEISSTSSSLFRVERPE